MKNLEKFKEKLFIARLHAQDSNAFQELYEYYLDRIYRFIFFKVNTREEAQDLTSEVFFKVWQYIYHKKGTINNLNAYLYQTARNIVSDFFRSRRGMNAVEFEKGLEGEILDTKQLEIFHQIDIQRDFERVEKVLRILRDEYREIIILKYIEGLSDKEISEILEKSKSAIRVTAHRAIQKIREILSKQKL